MKFKIVLPFLLLFSFKVVANIDELFKESLTKSKQFDIIQLTEDKTLADLETTSSTLYPTVDLVNTYRYGNNALNNFTDENEVDTQLALSLQHRLFQGGAEFALNDYRKLIPKQANSLKQKSLSEYYAQFCVLYFRVTSLMQEAERVESLLKNLKSRVKIVSARTRIGRDRKADLFALQSQLARLEADLFTTQTQLVSSKTEFLNFSGLESFGTSMKFMDPSKLSLKKEVNLEERPDFKNLELQYEASKLEAKVEKASNWPQVDVGANYFLDKSSFGRNDWEVSLNIRLNLLDFGQRSSAIQSKLVSASIDKARLDFNRLNAERGWNTIVSNFDAKKNELNALKVALDRSQLSYKEQLKDLDRGLITQIDVIRSLDDVISLEKLTIRSALEVKSLYYQANAYLGNYPKS